jgi:hypothetical protein
MPPQKGKRSRIKVHGNNFAFGYAVQSKVYNFCGSGKAPAENGTEQPCANLILSLTENRRQIHVILNKPVACNDEYLVEERFLRFNDYENIHQRLDNNYDPPAVSMETRAIFLKVIARPLTLEEDNNINSLLNKANNENPKKVQFTGNILS